MLLDVFILLGGLGTCFALALWLMGRSPSATATKKAVSEFVMQGHAKRVAWMGVGAVVVGSVVFVVARRGATRTLWESFAESHGLEISGRSAIKPLGRVHGDYRGRLFELTVVTRSDLHQREYESYVRMSIKLDGLPTGLTATRRMEMPGILGELAAVAARTVGVDDEITTGDEAFDTIVQVRGGDAPQVREWLEPARREMLRAFVEQDGYLITVDAVAWTARFPPNTRDELDQIATRLHRFATRLE